MAKRGRKGSSGGRKKAKRRCGGKASGSRAIAAAIAASDLHPGDNLNTRQQLESVSDPKLQVRGVRTMSHDIDGWVSIQWRPLNIERQLIFELQCCDPNLFLDLSSLRLCYRGKIVQATNDRPVDVPAPRMEFEEFDTNGVVEQATEPVAPDTVWKLKTFEGPVKHSRQVLKGLIVAPAALFGITQFKNISVTIGDYHLPNYAKNMLYLQAFMRTLLEFGPKPMDEQLKNALLTLDTSPSVKVGDSNNGLTSRYGMCGNSTQHNFIIPLSLVDGLSGFHQSKLLPGQTKLRIGFEKTKSEIAMIANEPGHDFETEIISPILEARYYRMTPEALRSFQSSIQASPIQLDFTSHEVDFRYLHKGITSFRLTLPQRDGVNADKFACILLTTDQFAGDYETNTFWALPHTLTSIHIDRGDGSRKTELDFDFESDRYEHLYQYFLDESNINSLSEVHPLISSRFFKDGRFVWVLDLTRNHSYRTGIKSAVRTIPSCFPIELTLNFKDVLPEQLVLFYQVWREESLFLDQHFKIHPAA